MTVDGLIKNISSTYTTVTVALGSAMNHALDWFGANLTIVGYLIAVISLVLKYKQYRLDKKKFISEQSNEQGCDK